MSVRYKIRDQHGRTYITYSICGWVDLFSRAVYREIVLDSWRYCAQHKGLQVWGYVIMPNHLHLIASTTTPFRLEDVLRDIKAHTARAFLAVLHDKNQPESRRQYGFSAAAIVTFRSLDGHRGLKEVRLRGGQSFCSSEAVPRLIIFPVLPDGMVECTKRESNSFWKQSQLLRHLNKI